MSKPKHHPLPCPFCGAEVEVEVGPNRSNLFHRAGAKGCLLDGYTLAWRATRAAAVKAWNKRAGVKS